MNQDFIRKSYRKNIIIPLIRFTPYFIKHFLLLPYRRNENKVILISSGKKNKQKRFLSALYDSVLNIVLEGYSEIMNKKILPETGQMMHYLIQLTIRFDEFLDKYRKTDQSLELKDVLSIPEVREELNRFRDYIKIQGREEEIISYLSEMFRNHYDRYIKLIKTDSFQESFEIVLELSQLDSGWLLASDMEIVRLFNNHSPSKKMQEEFFLLGTAGKFADDIGDIFSDIKRNHLNLFCSLVNDNPAEKDILYKAVNDNVKINFSWLDQHCHSTFVEYIRKMESFNSRITSKKLRLVFELSVLPAMWGIHLDSEHIAAG